MSVRMFFSVQYITEDFDFSALKNLIYNYFELRLSWIGFDLVELWINCRKRISCTISI